ncbi:MAG: TetR/AcrR family transcriptional regulator, partial [bacterium]
MSVNKHHNPPKQSRSRRTLEHIVQAALEILEEQGYTALTVQSVVDRANSSVGSFYARFSGKEDLLDYLGERVWDQALQRWDSAVRARDWSEIDLQHIAEGSMGLLVDIGASRA